MGSSSERAVRGGGCEGFAADEAASWGPLVPGTFQVACWVVVGAQSAVGPGPTAIEDLKVVEDGCGTVPAVKDVESMDVPVKTPRNIHTSQRTVRAAHTQEAAAMQPLCQ